MQWSSIGTAVLVKFDSLKSLENYVKSVHYSNWLSTFYFHVQFSKLKCTENVKSTVTRALKSDRMKKVSPLKKISRIKKKMKRTKEKYYRDPESRRKYRKRKKENPQQEKYYIWKKRNIRKILN